MAASMVEDRGSSPDFEQILVPDIEIKTEGEDSGNSQSAVSDFAVTTKRSPISKTSRQKPPTRTELKYHCDDCGKKFKSRSQLDNHSIIHSSKAFKCSQCPKVFRQKGHLTFHISEVHSGDKIYSCSKCDKNFSILDKLQYHIENVHDKIKPHVCSYCSKAFVRKFNLSCHLNSKKGKCGKQNKIRPFICPTCNKAFGQNHELQCHVTSCRELSTEVSVEERIGIDNATPSVIFENHKREINTDEYDNKGLNLIKTQKNSAHKKPIPALKRFLRNKSAKTLSQQSVCSSGGDISPEKCDITVMEKGGILANLLLSKHEPQINRKFKCCVCNLKFSILSDLKIHEEVHLCQLCGGVFSNLEYHISQVHFGSENKKCKHLSQCTCILNMSKQFSCVFCNHTFTYKLDLENHLKTKHNSIQDFSKLKHKLSLNNYEENMTKFMKEFLLPAQNECKHELLQFFSCHSCKQKFTNLNDLQQHVSRKHKICNTDKNIFSEPSELAQINEENIVCEPKSDSERKRHHKKRKMEKFSLS